MDVIKLDVMGNRAEASCNDTQTASAAVEVSSAGGVLTATTVITGNTGDELIVARATKQFPGPIPSGVSFHRMNIVIPPRMYNEAKDFIAMVEFRLVKSGQELIARKFYLCTAVIKPTSVPTFHR
jgi:uncharacterized OB-fold protein